MKSSKGQKEIVFLFPPGGRIYKFCHNLGQGYIQAYLKSKNIDTIQLVPRSISIPKLSSMIFSYKPYIVGFTCKDSNYYLVKVIATYLKTQNPDLYIAVGGPTATFSDRFIMKDCPAIDFCIRYEGEISAYELLRVVKNFDIETGDFYKELNKIRGLTYRTDRGARRNPDRKLLGLGTKDGLDIYPSPFITGVLNGAEGTGIVTSRGCTNKCIFCNFSIMNRYTIRFHSVERVIEELQIIARASPSAHVTFQDDSFGLDMERAKKICSEIARNNIRLTFESNMRFDCVDRELLTLMKRAGFNFINYGLESSNLNTLRKVRKCKFGKERDYIEKAKQAICWTNRLGMVSSVSIICGLPGENRKDILETLAFVKNQKVRSYSHNILHVPSGTSLSKNYRRHKIRLAPSTYGLSFAAKIENSIVKVRPLENAIQYQFLDYIGKEVMCLLDRLSDEKKDYFSSNDFSYIWLGEDNAHLRSGHTEYFRQIAKRIPIGSRVYVGLGGWKNKKKSFDNQMSKIKFLLKNHIPSRFIFGIYNIKSNCIVKKYVVNMDNGPCNIHLFLEYDKNRKLKKIIPYPEI